MNLAAGIKSRQTGCVIELLKNACLVCNGDMTDADILYQAKNFDFMLAPGKVAHQINPAKKAFAYAQPTVRDNTWTKWLDDFGWLKWVQQQDNDGLLLDTPFINYDFKRIRDIQMQLIDGPKVYQVCPNYGDFGTWTRKAPAAPGYGEMAAALDGAFTWAYVQNALDMRFFTPKLWSDLRSAANLRLATGRTLILGIYDPGRKNEQFCALLTHSFEHPHLYWQYCTDMASKDVTTNWNESWSWCR